MPIKTCFPCQRKPEKQSYVKGEKVKIDIQAAYYHGKPLSELKLNTRF